MNYIVLLGVFAVGTCGIISEQDHSFAHHERATSYQNIQREHFHAVPTYLKKEHKEYLEHPVSIGSSSVNLQVHHGDKHDHGFAITDSEQNIHGLDLNGGHDVQYQSHGGDLGGGAEDTEALLAQYAHQQEEAGNEYH